MASIFSVCGILWINVVSATLIASKLSVITLLLDSCLCRLNSTTVADRCCGFCLVCNSTTVHLLAAHRPKSRWSSCTGDRAYVQDGQGSVQPAGKGLDAQVRHVAVGAWPLADTTSSASSSCIHRLFVVDTQFIIASTLCVLLLTPCVCLRLIGQCGSSSDWLYYWLTALTSLRCTLGVLSKLLLDR